MGKLSSDQCPLAVIVTSLQDRRDYGTELPVKNTFIHFSDACLSDGYRTGHVQRFKTDPSSEPRSRLPGLCMEDSQSSTTSSGGSTPRALADESSSSDDSAEPLAPPPTPVSTTCWIESRPSELWLHHPAPQVHAPKARPAAVGPRSSPRTTSKLATSCQSAQYTLDESGDAHFGFTMRRAGGVDWGIDVTPDAGQQALVVDAVVPGGAIHAWNEQVKDGPNAKRALLVGDVIKSVNGKTDCQVMMHESNTNDTLIFQVLRQTQCRNLY